MLAMWWGENDHHDHDGNPCASLSDLWRIGRVHLGTGRLAASWRDSAGGSQTSRRRAITDWFPSGLVVLRPGKNRRRHMVGKGGCVFRSAESACRHEEGFGLLQIHTGGLTYEDRKVEERIMSYLRFTPEDFRAIQKVCRSIKLSDDLFAVFKYFLVESLTNSRPGLSQRLGKLPARKIRILYDYLREQKPSPVKKPMGFTKKAGQGCALTFGELQAVRKASGVFFLHDGALYSFQDYLVYAFQKTAPGLAAKLGHLNQQQIARLFREVKKPSRWTG
jgi:hypothetical protein